MTNGVRQGGILSPQLFNIYIDGLNDIINKSSVGGSVGGKRINHMLYASGSQPGGNSPLGGNSAFLKGGIRHCQDLKKNDAQYETEQFSN